MKRILKVLIALLFLLIIGSAGLYIAYPVQGHEAFVVADRKVRQILFERKVLVRGLRTVPSIVIEELIPKWATNLEFWITPEAIENKLLANPFIRSVAIMPCTTEWFPRCFTIQIEERAPHFVHIAKGEAVLLSDDGVTLAVVDEHTLGETLGQLVDPDAVRPKIIQGVITEHTSSDQFKARFDYVKESFKILEYTTGYQFDRMELLPSGELLARPAKANFLVQFDQSWGNREAFKEEVKRLNILLPEIRGRLSEVEKIDLAYDKLAVVAYRGPFLAPTPNAKGITK